MPWASPWRWAQPSSGPVASVIAKRLTGTPPHLIALVQVVVGVVLLAPFANFGALPHDSRSWVLLVTLGVVHTGLMYVLLYGAVQKLPTYLQGALSFIYPVVAIAVDFVAFGHRLQPTQWLGAAAILLAAAAMNLQRHRAPVVAAQPSVQGAK